MADEKPLHAEPVNCGKRSASFVSTSLARDKKEEALAHRATRSGLMEQRKQTTEQVPMGCIASHPRPEKLWE